MAKPFDAKKAKTIISQEFNFISEVFSKASFPVHHSSNEEDGVKTDGTNSLQGPVQLKINDNTTRAKTFEDLQSRLEKLKGQKKLDYKQKLLKKKLKNRLKKNSKREKRLLQKKLAITESNAAGASSTKGEDSEIQKVPKQKPIFNSEGHMVFSKFDFSEIGTKKRPVKVNKDPKKILEKLQEKKKKVKDLEASGESDKAQEIKEKDAWKAALAKASGEKVKDDPELLKRTIKREEQKKKMSAKKWESRIEGVQKSIQERQQKRQENIMKRKKDKKTNKLKKAAKKGRIIPGF